MVNVTKSLAQKSRRKRERFEKGAAEARDEHLENLARTCSHEAGHAGFVWLSAENGDRFDGAEIVEDVTQGATFTTEVANPTRAQLISRLRQKVAGPEAEALLCGKLKEFAEFSDSDEAKEIALGVAIELHEAKFVSPEIMELLLGEHNLDDFGNVEQQEEGGQQEESGGEDEEDEDEDEDDEDEEEEEMEDEDDELDK
ncbi:hypothetical protein niasHS_005202 [Heterodera schachtii]|uniref:Uncharacterized protein n=2 Tax=Heterodera TaxID=34509 RepID=A0ABD2JXY8_HETSC